MGLLLCGASGATATPQGQGQFVQPRGVWSLRPHSLGGPSPSLDPTGPAQEGPLWPVGGPAAAKGPPSAPVSPAAAAGPLGVPRETTVAQGARPQPVLRPRGHPALRTVPPPRPGVTPRSRPSPRPGAAPRPAPLPRATPRSCRDAPRPPLSAARSPTLRARPLLPGNGRPGSVPAAAPGGRRTRRARERRDPAPHPRLPRLEGARHAANRRARSSAAALAGVPRGPTSYQHPARRGGSCAPHPKRTHRQM